MDRGQLIKSFEESEKRSLQDVPTVAFENEFQEHLFKAWSQVLGSYNFRIDDNFFRVGGSSLTALTLGAFISKDLKIDMRACDILATPKFMDLARAIEAKIRSGTSKYIERKIQYYDSGPLSYGQQFDWTNGWGREQNIQSAWRRTSRYFELVGQLDVKVLRQAFRSLVERHHGLRIGFHLADGRLSQRLRKTPDDVLEVVDLTNLCLADSQSETAKKVREIHEERFNFLGDAILFKATLIIGAESRGILVIRSPHILVDGYSLKMILSDLGRLYRKMKSQSDKALGSEFDDRSRMTIVQLGHLQKESETTDVYQKRKLYWQTYVSQVKDTTSYGSPKEGVRDDEFVSASIELTVADSDKIADVCEALQCTRFELIFAIFSRHILRRCDRANTPIAVFHSGRISAADSEIVGNLSVTIPVFPKGRGSLEETIIENRRELTSGAQNLPFPMTEVWTAMNHVYPKIAINYAPLRQTLELDGVEVKRNVSLEDVHGPIDTIYDLILGFDERKLGFFCRKAFLSQSELNGVVSDIKGELSSLISDQTSKAA